VIELTLACTAVPGAPKNRGRPSRAERHAPRDFFPRPERSRIAKARHSKRPDPRGPLALGALSFWTGEREAAGGHCLGGRLAPQGRRIMQQKLYWLDYDPVAFAVLVIGMGMIGLLTLFI
jgi:hypothetical protein